METRVPDGPAFGLQPLTGCRSKTQSLEFGNDSRETPAILRTRGRVSPRLALVVSRATAPHTPGGQAPGAPEVTGGDPLLFLKHYTQRRDGQERKHQ